MIMLVDELFELAKWLGIIGIVCVLIAYRLGRRYSAIESALYRAIYEAFLGKTARIVCREHLWLGVSDKKVCLMDNKHSEFVKVKRKMMYKYMFRSLGSVREKEYKRMVEEIKSKNLKRFILVVDKCMIVGIRVEGGRVSLLLEDGKVIKVAYCLYEPMISLLPEKIMRI